MPRVIHIVPSWNFRKAYWHFYKFLVFLNWNKARFREHTHMTDKSPMTNTYREATMRTSESSFSNPQHLRRLATKKTSNVLLFMSEDQKTALFSTHNETFLLWQSPEHLKFHPKPAGQHYHPGISGIPNWQWCCHSANLEQLMSQPEVW